MGEFQYKARDPGGRVKTGTIKAATKAQAKSQLARMRLRALTIKATKLDVPTNKEGGGAEPTGLLAQFFYRDDKGRLAFQLGEAQPSAKDLIVFTKQFATMIGAGVPLMQAIGVLGAQQRVRSFGRCLDKIRFAVENGSTLSDALEAYPKIFDTLYVAMVKAGEASGNLDTILLKLCTYIEKASKIKSQVKSAMFYPLMVVFVAIAVISVLLIFVVPSFAKQYTDAGKQLPGLTALVIGISNILAEDWYIIIGGAVGFFMALRQYIQTDSGRAKWDALLLKAPGFGQLFRKLSVGRFCNTMSAMLTSGVPLLEALSICAASSGNKTIETFVLNVRSHIEQGAKFSEPLAEGGLFPPMVISMVSVGEQTGALDDMLVKVSEFYEDEVDLAVKTLLSMIEPAMIVTIGTIVGVIVIAMYLPVFDMANIAGG